MGRSLLLLCILYHCRTVYVDAVLFTGGSFLALRVTSGSNLAATATAFVIEERSGTTGALLQTVSVTACRLSGTSTMGGQLSQSPNGMFSIFVCYNANVGAANPATTTVERGAVLINSDASLGSFIGFGQSYTVPRREVYGAVIADAAKNFYITGDGGNLRGALFAFFCIIIVVCFVRCSATALLRAFRS